MGGTRLVAEDKSVPVEVQIQSGLQRYVRDGGEE